MRWCCRSKDSTYDAVDQGASKNDARAAAAAARSNPESESRPDASPSPSRESQSQPTEDVNAIRSWRERHPPPVAAVAASSLGGTRREDEEKNNHSSSSTGTNERLERTPTAKQQQRQPSRRGLSEEEYQHFTQQEHLLRLHEQQQQKELETEEEPELIDQRQNRQGGFPTFSKEEEDWRQQQQLLNKETYLSSSSSSCSVEDPIILRRSLPVAEHQSTGASFLGGTVPEEEEGVDDEEELLCAVSRPGTDDGENKPLGPRAFSHVKVSDVQFPRTASNATTISTTTSTDGTSRAGTAFATMDTTRSVVPEEQHLDLHNSSVESDELDAIVAAIEDQTQQQQQQQQQLLLRQHRQQQQQQQEQQQLELQQQRKVQQSTPPPQQQQVHNTMSAGDSPVLLLRPDRSNLSPVHGNDVSLLSHPKTPPSSRVHRLAPSRRDSPSVHDSSAFESSSSSSPAVITPHSVNESHDSSMVSGRDSRMSSPSVAKVPADQRRRERSRSRSRNRAATEKTTTTPASTHSGSVSSSSAPRPIQNNGSVDLSREASTHDALHSTDKNDRLSDIPSDVDVAVRQRYLKACRLLKSSLIEKDAMLEQTEKAFLAGLLREESLPIKPLSPTPDQVYEIENAARALRTNPLFDSTTSVASSGYSPIIEDFVAQSDRDVDDTVQTSFTAETTLSSRGLSSATLHEGGYENDSQRKSAVSQTSSSLFSRIDDDFPFKMLGADGCKPAVMTPTVMEALRGFFPFAVAEENFLLKYSLERDGAALVSLLSKVRACTHTIISVETVDGFVFGAFCSSPWRLQSSWYGSGESFLWRLKNPRIKNNSQTYDNDGDNEIEIYPFTGADEMVQYCTSQTIAVGGGTDWASNQYGSPFDGEPSGIGFLIDGDLLGGETSSCVTFGNPRLGNRSDPSVEFEIQALEVWTVTPCLTLEDAEEMEMKRMFFEEMAVGR